MDSDADKLEEACKFYTKWQELLLFCERDPSVTFACSFFIDFVVSIICAYHPGYLVHEGNQRLNNDIPNLDPADVAKHEAWSKSIIFKSIQGRLIHSKNNVHAREGLSKILAVAKKWTLPWPFLDGCNKLMRLTDLSPPPTTQESEEGFHALLAEVENWSKEVLRPLVDYPRSGTPHHQRGA